MTKQEDLEFLQRIREIINEYGHGNGDLVRWHSVTSTKWSGPVCALGAIAIDSGKLYAARERYDSLENEAKRFVELTNLTLHDIDNGKSLFEKQELLTSFKTGHTSYADTVWYINDRGSGEILVKLDNAIERLQQEVKSEERELVLV